MNEDLFKQQKPNENETLSAQPSIPDAHLAELEEKIQQTEVTNKVW